MNSKALNMLAVGDIILGADAESFFTFVTPVLKAGDVVLGQLEVPYTTRDRHAVELGRVPSNLTPLISAGFDVVTLAGNHISDAGVPGIEDTIAWLRNHNIAFAGAGMDISEARCPVIIEREGTRFGFLSYNCVGPKETWATSEKPGCAYVHIITHYELDHATPGGPPDIYTWAESKTLGAMVDDIRKLRPLCDILVVSFHKGLGHTPIKLAAYEHQVSYAAIDAGADLIVGHHAHILKGIELYKGKAIFHGLCNFVTFLPIMASKPDQDPQSWARRRRELFGFEPDPEYPTYPFHPEAKYTIIAKCAIKDRRISQTSYIPCLVNKQGQPEILENDERGQEVFDYMEKITQGAGLNARYEWKGNEVLVHAAY
jgi:hypothetical protein